ncbi:carbohydrate ABC transporter permease [Paenibacillus humicola]|uniref:carbohydrate ABC transporter permease n=1 Tax=Paenibacillus humicola TaxID=3110540 RepID=UPI00237A88E5|nr:carbohydrate ABC transporter permease [Paenibacillus humicola]
MPYKKMKFAIWEISLIAVTVVYLFPFYIMVTQALKTPPETLKNPLRLPATLYLDNIKSAWKLMNFGTVLTNTFLVTLVSVVGIALISGMCSFTLAKRRSKMYGIMYYVFVCGLLIPFYMTLSPLVKMMKDLFLMNSLLGLSLAYIGRGIPFAVFLYVGFIRSIPQEMGDSALIDGCSPGKMYWYIYFPMVKHITATSIILNALWVWNDFLFPLLTLQDAGKRTITLAQYAFYGMYNTQWNLAFASYLLSMLPLVAAYFLLQRSVVEGIAAGAVKG